MSLETLDVRWFLQIVRRIWTAVGTLAVCGLLAGIAVAALHPPMVTSQALVVLPQPAPSMAAQVVIASSDPVLSGALPHVSSAMSLATLRGEVQVKNLTPYILSISAKGTTAARAEATANAVADSYIAYVRSPSSPVGHVPAQMLEVAVDATGRPLPIDLLITGGLGALLGALIGAIDAVAFSRSDRRFRTIW